MVVSDYGQPKYLLTLYTPPAKRKPGAKDYLARMKKFQPQPMKEEEAAALQRENRGER